MSTSEIRNAILRLMRLYMYINVLFLMVQNQAVVHPTSALGTAVFLHIILTYYIYTYLPLQLQKICFLIKLHIGMVPVTLDIPTSISYCWRPFLISIQKSTAAIISKCDTPLFVFRDNTCVFKESPLPVRALVNYLFQTDQTKEISYADPNNSSNIF